MLRSGRLSLGPLLPEFERAFAARVGAPFASAVSSGTAGLHLALRAVGVSDGDEVITSPFSFVASANVAVYERARPVFADIDPVTFNLSVDAAAAAVSDADGRDPAGSHLRLSRPTSPGFERLGLPIVEDACEALGAVHGDGVPVGGRGHPAVFGFYANKQLTTGEGGMVTVADAALKERIDSERNQGRAPNMDWLDHDRLGFNYRLSDRRVRARPGSARAARRDAGRAGAGRVAVSRGAGADRGPRAARARTSDGNRRGWFVFVVQLPRRRRPRLGRARAVRRSASRASPTSRRCT